MPLFSKTKSSSLSSTKYGTCSPLDPKKTIDLTQKKSGYNNTNTSGDSSDRSDRRPAIGTKPLNFTIECSGLKPNTQHRFYYKNKDYTENCRSLMTGQDISSTKLISDSFGKLNLKFQLVVNTTKTGKDIVNLQEPAGDALFELRAENSIARSLVKFKNF